MPVFHGLHQVLLLQGLDLIPELPFHVLVPPDQHPYGLLHLQQALQFSSDLRSWFKTRAGDLGEICLLHWLSLRGQDL